MTQLWAWEYQGKTEVGTQKPGNSCVFKSAASEAIPILCHTDHITNLRKVKVVDEDDAVVSGVKADDLDFILEKAVRALPKDSKIQDQLASVRVRLQGVTPPITEPKNFGAIVEASHKGTLSLGRIKWVRLRVEGYRDEWWSDKNMGSACWSDLNNPTIISEGVEG